MKSTGKALPVETVSEQLRHYLQHAYHPQSDWRIGDSPGLRYMPWSTIYFFDVYGVLGPDDPVKRLVVKIPSFPDQTSPELSWQSDDLLTRGKREYSSMVRVFNHFASQDKPYLHALRPETYLENINAVVMDFISSGTLYDNTISPRHLIKPRGRQNALTCLRRTGEWLHWLHELPVMESPPDRTLGPQNAFEELQHEAEQLQSFGIKLEQWPLWDEMLHILSQVQQDRMVWSHGDFHMRNVFVLPGDHILSIDTALDFLDSPCVDIAKFCVDLQTRRSRLLTRGLIPPSQLVTTLINAFIDGYCGPDTTLLNPRALALYEGQFLLEKWVQSRTTLAESTGRLMVMPAAAVARSSIDITMSQLLQAWLKRVITLD